LFGKANNTYTMAGIASAESRAVQTGPLQVVTTDASGNLASDGGAFQRRIDALGGRIDSLGGALQRQIDALGQRDRELTQGIAMAVALQQPIFHNGQNFAGRFGYGNFGGSNAFGLSVGGVISRGAFGPTSTVTLDGGVGYGTSTGAKSFRGGVNFGW
jgi:trimeric autotransporter adhesin